MMGAYVEQLECLNCSQSRSFVLHGDREQRILGRTEAACLSRGIRRGLLLCARCGSSSLIRGWGDATPYATVRMPRRRRPGSAHTGVAQEN
jgi:hypothetical protein